MKTKLTIFVGLCFRLSLISAQSWSPVGLGMNNPVQAICRFNGYIYAGGFFTQADGLPANRIAKWDGISWQSAGNFNNGVLCLCVYNNELYAGGRFTVADGNTVNYIAKWNGVNWVSVGTGSNGYVYCMYVYQNQLYVGGLFSIMNGVTVNGIAQWNGIIWTALTSGVYIPGPSSYEVNTLVEYQGTLYVGGFFTQAGGLLTQNLARWNGSWSQGTSTTGPDFYVYSQCLYNNFLYVGGRFLTLDGIVMPSITKYNGTSWSIVGMGLNLYLISSSVYQNQLYVGGSFLSHGAQNVGNIGRWNGSGWQQFDTGINGEVRALFTDTLTNILYAGGQFSLASGSVGDHIAQLYISPLPIELSSFDVFCRGNQSDITWSTVSEKNNDYFSIERSDDCKMFEVLGIVKSGGNTTAPKSYSFVDTSSSSGTQYYRLTQTDFNGVSSVLGTRSAKCDRKRKCKIFYDHETDEIIIDDVSINVNDLKVCSIIGQYIITHSICQNKSITRIPFQDNSPGIYIIYDKTHTLCEKFVK